MGDRANVLIKSDNESGVYLYSHWDGSNLHRTVQDALKKKQRWNDEQYLNRIIFCEMIKDNIKGETGYGITSFVCDGGSRIIHVDVEMQQIKLKGNTYSFEEYIKLDLKNIYF